MQISKKKLNATIQKQIEEIFFQLISDTHSTQEAKIVFGDLLTETERQAVMKRLSMALFLDKGRSYENIKNYLKVSSATIASMQEQMGNPGIQMALSKIKADRWADDWTGKISALVEKIIPKK